METWRVGSSFWTESTENGVDGKRVAMPGQHILGSGLAAAEFALANVAVLSKPFRRYTMTTLTSKTTVGRQRHFSYGEPRVTH